MKAVVLHSGGMDSSICLALAIEKYGNENVLSLSFNYDQRHKKELQAAQKIAAHLGVSHEIFDLSKMMKPWQESALIDSSKAITHEVGGIPTTFVKGRNGIFAHIAAIYAASKGAFILYMGVMELEGANSGYPDCSRAYMDLVEQIVRLDLQNPEFRIETPLIYEDKCSSLVIAQRLGQLSYFLEETITCYEGIAGKGCQICPACKLRNEGVQKYMFTGGVIA